MSRNHLSTLGLFAVLASCVDAPPIESASAPKDVQVAIRVAGFIEAAGIT